MKNVDYWLKAIEREIDAMIRFFLQLLALLPRRLLQFMGSGVGYVNYYLNTRASKVTRVNLALCGQVPEIRKESLIETGKTMMETPSVWLGKPEAIDDWIGEVHGEELLGAAVKDDRGLLVLLPHIGNWELFNVFYRRYGQMTALYHPPRQAFMRALMTDIRGRHGNEMVPTNRQGLTRLYKTLNTGGTVVVLPDQVPASGRYVPFFGQMVLTDELSIRLIRKTGARPLGLSLVRTPSGRFDVYLMEPEVSIYSEDIEVATKAINELIERSVALSPAQYQWEYKRFRERPAGESKVYRFNKPPGFHS